MFIPSLSWAGVVYRMVTYYIKELFPSYCPFIMFLSKQPENLSKVKSFSRPDATQDSLLDPSLRTPSRAPITQDSLLGP